MRRILAISAAVGAIAAIPAVAYASTSTSTTGCVTVHDHITKTDTGHGTPAEWADLSMSRSTKVCGDEKAGYTVTLVDNGTLWTRKGAGAPDGTGGQILNRVPGVVHGTYSLTATGGKLVNKHGDTSLSSTEYVRSLFTPDTTVTGGDYSWAYTTVCGEKWVDSSANADGQGAQAGNITGKTCHTRPPKPKPTSESPKPSPSKSAPGEAPVPTPVRSNLPVTG